MGGDHTHAYSRDQHHIDYYGAVTALTTGLIAPTRAMFSMPWLRYSRTSDWPGVRGGWLSVYSAAMSVRESTFTERKDSSRGRKASLSLWNLRRPAIPKTKFCTNRKIRVTS